MREEEFWASVCKSDAEVNQFWKLHPRPKNVAPGDNIHYAEGGIITSWSPIIGLGYKSFTCQVSGKEWSGYHAQLGRTRVLVNPRVRCSRGLQTWEYVTPRVQKALDAQSSELLTRDVWWKIYLDELSYGEILYFTLLEEGADALEQWKEYCNRFNSLRLDQYQWMKTAGQRVMSRLKEAIASATTDRRKKILDKQIKVLSETLGTIALACIR